MCPALPGARVSSSRIRAHKRRLADQPFEAEYHLLQAKSGIGPIELLDAVVINDRYQLADLRIAGAAITEKFVATSTVSNVLVSRLMTIDALGRILEHFVHA